MVNSLERLSKMKGFMRGGPDQPWNCRAGLNTLIIRVDGTLAPCFSNDNASEDWGRVGQPRFDKASLDAMKQSCELHCFSTLNHTVGSCYNDRRVIELLVKQAAHGFQGIRGNVD